MLVSGAISDLLTVLPPVGGHHRLPKFRYSHTNFDAKNFLSGGFVKSGPSFCYPKPYNGPQNGRAREFAVRVSADPSDNGTPVAPLDFESKFGKLLAEKLRSHPHLFLESVDHHLEKLRIDRDAQKKVSPSSQYILYKRIAEIKENERQTALEEIIYYFIVHKFMENKISMIAKRSEISDPVVRVDLCQKQMQRLKSVHSPEAFEMIENQLSRLVRVRTVGSRQTAVKVSNIVLSKVYAGAVVFGYFIKRLDERFQLDKILKTCFGGPSIWDSDSLVRFPYDDDDDDDMDAGEDKSRLNNPRKLYR